MASTASRSRKRKSARQATRAGAVARKSGGTRKKIARSSARSDRLDVLKTYKIYIGGKFPRTESGRYYILHGRKEKPIANICRCTKKDFRDAVVAARAALAGWSGASAYLRGQILYRVAEMLEGRQSQFVDELQQQGSSKRDAKREVERSIDRLVYYAGWTDKFQQIFSSVNPVASSHFNFSMCEPTGIVSIVAPQESGLLGLISNVAPAIAGGNTTVVLASETLPLCAVTFAEVLHSSDVPGGVVNILTGQRGELLDQFSTHMDVNAVVYCGSDAEEIREVQWNAAGNVKRTVMRSDSDWSLDDAQGPYHVADTQEIKTIWHPIGT